jgi:hypothetical protein
VGESIECGEEMIAFLVQRLFQAVLVMLAVALIAVAREFAMNDCKLLKRLNLFLLQSAGQ